MMRQVLLAGVFAAGFGASANAAVLTARVFDNGTLIDTVTSSNGAVTLNSADAAFSDITLNATGSPLIPGADLSSVTLDVKDISPGAHTLTADVLQTGVSAGPGRTQSTFTVNDLIGAGNIGPTTESTFINGSDSTLGSLLASHPFPAGVTSDHFGPVDVSTGAIFADAHQYVISFSGPGSANDSIELTTGVPEPSTWAMLLSGFALMAVLSRRKRRALVS